MLGQIALVRAGQDGGQLLQGEQLRVKRINERTHCLLQVGTLDVLVPFGQHGLFFGANED